MSGMIRVYEQTSDTLLGPYSIATDADSTEAAEGIVNSLSDWGPPRNTARIILDMLREHEGVNATDNECEPIPLPAQADDYTYEIILTDPDDTGKGRLAEEFIEDIAIKRAGDTLFVGSFADFKRFVKQ